MDLTQRPDCSGDSKCKPSGSPHAQPDKQQSFDDQGAESQAQDSCADQATETAAKHRAQHAKRHCEHGAGGDSKYLYDHPAGDKEIQGRGGWVG